MTFTFRFKGSGSGKVITDVGAFLKAVHLFDFLEFAVASKDAVLMPLSTRKLIETTFLALLDSGIHYRGQNIGCFMAGVGHDLYALSGHVCNMCLTEIHLSDMPSPRMTLKLADHLLPLHPRLQTAFRTTLISGGRLFQPIRRVAQVLLQLILPCRL